MHPDDTIAAISTPAGQGGIGIVRLSGGNAVQIADTLFLSPKKKQLKTSPSHRIFFGYIKDPASSEIIDEVLVSVMRAPNTYTKEDIIEINCHGGAIPLKRVLELVLRSGARPAGPGEFTQRAFLNGRIDLAQAEAVLDIINSLTVQSQKTAVAQLRGNLSDRISGIREKLIELTAFVEAYIDFPEEDIEPPSLQKMKAMAQKIHLSLKRLIDSSQYGLILREGLKTAIVGRPNVGKSSLLNALLEHDRAIVTDMPGTTRDVIEEYLNIEGIPLRIMDTAGIRTVKNLAEKEGVKRSLHTLENADLVLLVIDGSKVLHKADKELIEKTGPDRTILIINKTDLPQKAKPGRTGISTVKISAKKGTGLKQLKAKIVSTALKGKTECSSELVTNTRHVHALEKACMSMNSFMEGIKRKESPEFLSVELREALDAIGEILGITTPDDILNHIFDNFCIGK
jgi:tRNA modification GTPase